MKNTVKIIQIKALSELCGLTPRRLYQLAEENKIPAASDGQFPEVETLTALFTWFNRDSEKLKKEKLLTAIANRKIKEKEFVDSENTRIDRATAINSVVAVAMQSKSIVRAEVERYTTADRRQKLLELGVSAQNVAAFHEWDIARSIETFTKIENAFSNDGKTKL